MKIEITKAPNLLTNGFVKTSGSDGTLGVDTATYQTANSNLTSLAALAYGSASFVKMTAANTFALDTATYLTSLGVGSVTQAWNAKLDSISALASAAGWLHNDGAGVFTYSTPTYGDVGAAPAAGSSSIVTVGTITTGIWNAGAVTSSGIVTGTQIHSSASDAGRMYWLKTDAPAQTWAIVGNSTGFYIYDVTASYVVPVWFAAGTGAATFAAGVSATQFTATSTADLAAVALNGANSRVSFGEATTFIGRAEAANYHITGSAAGDMIIRSTSGKNLLLGNNTTLGLAISAGNVGIGTAAPLVRLQSEFASSLPATSGSTVTSNFRLSYPSGTICADFGLNAASPYGLWIQATRSTGFEIHDPIVLQPNGGNVGIGTTAPKSILDVNGKSCFQCDTRTNLNGARAPMMQTAVPPSTGPEGIASSLWIESCYDGQNTAGMPGPFSNVNCYQYVSSPSSAPAAAGVNDFALWGWNTTLFRYEASPAGLYGYEMDLCNTWKWAGTDPSCSHGNGATHWNATGNDLVSDGSGVISSNNYYFASDSVGKTIIITGDGAGNHFANQTTTIASVSGGAATLTVSPGNNKTTGSFTVVGVLHTATYPGNSNSYATGGYYVNNTHEGSIVGFGAVLADIPTPTGQTTDGSAGFLCTVGASGVAYTQQAAWRYGYVASGIREYAFYSGGRSNNESTFDTNQKNVEPLCAYFNDTNATSFLKTTGTHTTILDAGYIVIQQALVGTRNAQIAINAADFGYGMGGGQLVMGYNSNGATYKAAGALVFQARDATLYYLWVDHHMKLRIHTVPPYADNSTDTDELGTVIGTQT